MNLLDYYRPSEPRPRSRFIPAMGMCLWLPLEGVTVLMPELYPGGIPPAGFCLALIAFFTLGLSAIGGLRARRRIRRDRAPRDAFLTCSLLINLLLLPTSAWFAALVWQDTHF